MASGTIIVNSSPDNITGNISGSAATCPESAGNIYSISPVTNATTYTWSVPTGWTITNGQGITSITVTSGSTGQNGDISVFAGNSCGTSPNLSKYLSLYSLPLIITQPASLVLNTGQSADFNITVDGASSYQWRKNGINITGANSTNFTIGSVKISDAGNYDVNIKNSNNCSITSSIARLEIRETNIGDSLILVALYNSTNGPGWTNRTNWLTGPVKNWYGITIDAGNGRVYGISLRNNKLKGAIPLTIGDLTNMHSLDFSEDEINGTIPSTLGNLTNLQYLDLSNNQLTGTFPS
jgi:Immunoglobulin I-set domain.